MRRAKEPRQDLPKDLKRFAQQNRIVAVFGTGGGDFQKNLRILKEIDKDTKRSRKTRPQ